MNNKEWLYHRLMYSLAPPHRTLVALRPEPGQLPPPLERAVNQMIDAKSADEAQAAAKEFLLLSKEWSD